MGVARGRWSAAAATALLAACVFGPDDAGIPIEDRDLTPLVTGGSLADTPTGPNVEVFHGTVLGTPFEIAAQADAFGACIAIRRGAVGSESCGPVPVTGIEEPVPLLEDAEIDALGIGGLAASDVASVIVETTDGRVATALLIPLDAAGIDANAFVVYVARDIVGMLVARTADGTELARLEFDPGR